VRPRSAPQLERLRVMLLQQEVPQRQIYYQRRAAAPIAKYR
jgi:hypothetical protein